MNAYVYVVLKLKCDENGCVYEEFFGLRTEDQDPLNLIIEDIRINIEGTKTYMKEHDIPVQWHLLNKWEAFRENSASYAEQVTVLLHEYEEVPKIRVLGNPLLYAIREFDIL